MSDGKGGQDTTLKRAIGPFQIWAIGVGMVISGHYFGWNFGVSTGGYLGMLLATVFMAVMYLGMIFCIAELATVMPHAGGPYSFARRTMGPLAGFITGIGVILEYFIAAPVVSLGVGGYVNFLFPEVPIIVSALVIYVFFICVHIIGIGEYANLETVIVLIALSLLVIFYAIGTPNISAANLFGEPAVLLPQGAKGIWACLPYAMWLFLAIEMLPMLSEECKDPVRDMPRGIVAAMVTLIVMAGLTLTIGVGIGGWEKLGVSENPLPDAVSTIFGTNFWLAKALATIGILGLLASFSGVILGYSRQLFALSRAGYLPGIFAKLHPTRRTPYWALIIPSVVGLALVLLFDPDQLILIATFGALISYISMCLSCIILRKKEPDIERAFKVPGYPVVPWLSVILGFITLFSSIFREWQFFIVSVVIFALAIIYYYAYARHNINPNAPEEEAAIAAAQQELEGK